MSSIERTGTHLRTNYRLTGGKVDMGALESHVVRLRQSWVHESDTGDIISFSMDGYGRPLWVKAVVLSDHRLSLIQVNISVSTTGSVCVASILQTASMGSLAATVTYPYEIICLIASR